MYSTIKKLREQNNYSQSALSERLGISRQMYVKYENGDVEPPVRVIRQLCSLYHVSYDFIIDDTLSENTNKQLQGNIYYVSSEKDDIEACSPDTSYGPSITYRNKSTRSFENVVEAVRKVPSEQLPAILAFVSFLKQQTSSEAEANIIMGTQDKTAFFKLAGKINLNNDELTEFREASII